MSTYIYFCAKLFNICRDLCPHNKTEPSEEHNITVAITKDNVRIEAKLFDGRSHLTSSSFEQLNQGVIGFSTLGAYLRRYPVFPVIQLTAEVLGVLGIGLHAMLLDTVNMHPTKRRRSPFFLCTMWDKTASSHDSGQGWKSTRERRELTEELTEGELR